jgi:hypothetical protein
MHCILCIVLYALCSLDFILCVVFYALYSIHCILCIVICIVFYVLYSSYFACYSLCIVFPTLFEAFELTLKLVDADHLTDRPSDHPTDGHCHI